MQVDLKTAGWRYDGCALTRKYLPWANAATDEDWGTEYLDLILAVKVVADAEEALAHIQRYGTRHSKGFTRLSASPAFFTSSSTAVYVNASTRFTDGLSLVCAELGISTQKLARGPMGLRR